MNAKATNISNHGFRKRQSAWIGTLLLWLIPQLAILFLSLAHVPLWLSGPIRMDDLALPQLLCVQLILSAMLFPYLLGRWSTALPVILTSWPMIQLAAAVSATPAAQWIEAAMFLSLLMLGLALWAGALPNDDLRLLGAAVMSGWILGGVAWVYLRAEFSGPSFAASSQQCAEVCIPLFGLLSQLRPGRSIWVWVSPLTLISTGLIAILARRWRMSCRQSHIH